MIPPQLLLAGDPMTTEALKEATDFLSSKDLRWWFAGLFILFVLTGVWIVRLLLNYHQQHVTGMSAQLSEQRATNKELSERLLTYITTDHQASMQAQRHTAAALEKLSDAIDRLRA
jgi:hypothetical protein